MKTLKKLSVIILFVLLSLSYGCNKNLNKQQNKTDDNVWLQATPIQCLGNAWEVDWLQNNNNDYDTYNLSGVAEKMQIISNFYSKIGVYILKIKSVKYPPNISVCEACSCIAGYTLYVHINKKHLDKMLNQDIGAGQKFKISPRL
jgi:hypothetical protein